MQKLINSKTSLLFILISTTVSPQFTGLSLPNLTSFLPDIEHLSTNWGFQLVFHGISIQQNTGNGLLDNTIQQSACECHQFCYTRPICKIVTLKFLSNSTVQCLAYKRVLQHSQLLHEPQTLSLFRMGDAGKSAKSGPWYYFPDLDGLFYYIEPIWLSQPDAKAACVVNGARLAVLKTKKNLESAVKLLNFQNSPSSYGCTEMWIDLEKPLLQPTVWGEDQTPLSSTEADQYLEMDLILPGTVFQIQQTSKAGKLAKAKNEVTPFLGYIVISCSLCQADPMDRGLP